MYYDNEGLNFLADFWWLAFPLCWLGIEAAKGWARQQRGRQITKLAQTYAEQGKEPPPAILEALRQSGHRHNQ